MKNVTAFSSVIFPNNLAFFDTFLNSLNNQTYKDFDLLIFNDGCPYDVLIEYIEKYDIYYIIIEVQEKTPMGIRKELINYLKESKYKTVVFGDTDDYFSKNRVSMSLNLIDNLNYDIIFNDLTIVDEKENVIASNVWKHKEAIKKNIDFNFLIKHNVLGMGNTAMKVKYIKNTTFKFDETIFAFDWMFYLQLLYFCNGLKLKFINELTYYRQHGLNTIGLNNMHTIEKLEKTYDTKDKIYKFCDNNNIKIPKKIYKNHNNFKKITLDNKHNFKKHLNKLNRSEEYPFWFENVLLKKIDEKNTDR